mmetsp:Transcript_5050/g.18182  ORF Transcript_5050/g.18182 Transcript_5050/m.18182 type:complete len:661 (-) Transcript_5050:103-2085(-)
MIGSGARTRWWASEGADRDDLTARRAAYTRNTVTPRRSRAYTPIGQSQQRQLHAAPAAVAAAIRRQHRVPCREPRAASREGTRLLLLLVGERGLELTARQLAQVAARLQQVDRLLALVVGEDADGQRPRALHLRVARADADGADVGRAAAAKAGHRLLPLGVGARRQGAVVGRVVQRAHANRDARAGAGHEVEVDARHGAEAQQVVLGARAAAERAAEARAEGEVDPGEVLRGGRGDDAEHGAALGLVAVHGDDVLARRRAALVVARHDDDRVGRPVALHGRPPVVGRRRQAAVGAAVDVQVDVGVLRLRGDRDLDALVAHSVRVDAVVRGALVLREVDDRLVEQQVALRVALQRRDDVARARRHDLHAAAPDRRLRLLGLLAARDGRVRGHRRRRVGVVKRRHGAVVVVVGKGAAAEAVHADHEARVAVVRVLRADVDHVVAVAAVRAVPHVRVRAGHGAVAADVHVCVAVNAVHCDRHRLCCAVERVEVVLVHHHVAVHRHVVEQRRRVVARHDHGLDGEARVGEAVHGDEHRVTRVRRAPDARPVTQVHRHLLRARAVAGPVRARLRGVVARDARVPARHVQVRVAERGRHRDGHREVGVRHAGDVEVRVRAVGGLRVDRVARRQRARRAGCLQSAAAAQRRRRLGRLGGVGRGGGG